MQPERVKFSFNQDDFLTAGQIWIDIKQGKLKVNKLVPDYRRGIDGAKYRLLNDINALMKNELFNYDWIVREAAPQAPRIFSWTYAKLDQSKKDLLDNLAYLSINADNNFQQLKAIYSEYVPPESLRI